ncbi:MULTISPECIES: sensor histidine kinase [Paenibacillus]|uniref:sensor histidine kinase n=1 Tax=Paenibacillus TaxID=44249 RepID=UPI0022B8E212|nr:sensor histidine kinase [Paenibacillus caseinilyticus]MCZ8519631.1 sensor histidine kinase [Paenibacillus caseinilyticus]
MAREDVGIGGSPLAWKWFFGVKLALGLALTGAFYWEHSMTLFWKLSTMILSLVFFLLVHYFYLNTKRKQNWLFPILIIDFFVSACYGYVYIDGQFPNHLFIGMTALAILLFVKNTRRIILACLLLLSVYLALMVSIDWYVYQRLDATGYFISGSFIVFAGIVSSLIRSYQRAHQDTQRLYAQLMQSHERVQAYALRTEEWAAARERVRISREIHDSVGHKLTALLVQMQAARKLGRVDSLRSEQMYLECEEIIRSSLQEVRLSVRAIREEPAVSTSLNDNLRKLSEEFTRFAEVQTAFEVNGIPAALPGTLQLTAYRIVQESLTNAQKHGRARHARILLDYSESGFTLSISNDGEIPAQLKPGFGLINLQERVREWNGELQFCMDPHADFAVKVRFPYSAAEKELIAR